MTDTIAGSVFTKNKWNTHGVYPEYVIIRYFGSVNNYMGMITVSRSTACLIHTQTNE